MIDQRPHEDEEGKRSYQTFDEDYLLATQGLTQFQASALLNDLSDMVRRAEYLPLSSRLRLLYGISRLRGYVHAHSRRMLAETQGRCN